MSQPFQASEILYTQAARLLDAKLLQQKVRLIGVGASNLVGSRTPAQIDLFESQQIKDLVWDNIDQAVDAINVKFGQDTVSKATLIDPSRKS